MNYVKINVKYISNFNYKTNFNKNLDILARKNNKIFCKNLILIFILMKYFSKKTNFNFFVLPKSKSNLTILRSPYRHKLTRHQLTYSRFHLSLNLSLNLNEFIKINNFNQINIFILKILKIFKFFETNICNQNKITIMFYTFFENFFRKNI